MPAISTKVDIRSKYVGRYAMYVTENSGRDTTIFKDTAYNCIMLVSYTPHDSIFTAVNPYVYIPSLFFSIIDADTTPFHELGIDSRGKLYRNYGSVYSYATGGFLSNDSVNVEIKWGGWHDHSTDSIRGHKIP